MRKHSPLQITGWVILSLMILLFITPLPTLAAEEGSLQQLIDATPANGELKLEGKVYKGNIDITKPITIIGQKGTEIHGEGDNNVITIHASDTTIDSVTIKYGGLSRDSEEEFSGVRVMGENNVLKNLTISDIYHGIFLTKSKQTTIKNSHITGQGEGKLGDQGNGIHIARSSGSNIIEDNKIQNTRDGIFVEYSNNNEINRNTVTHTRYGLHYMYSNDNHFSDNHFNNNLGGAAIMHSDHILLENNEFSYNQGSRSFGLLIQASRDIEVYDNQFHLNQRGLYLEQSTSNRIEDNDIFHNQIGVEIWASSTAHVFIKNAFNKNNSDVVAIGGYMGNEWFENGVGNYWNKPMFDLNQDGVGDSTFQYTSSLANLLEDNELAYLFLSSPAINIYEKMNAMFSNNQIMAEDEYPLMPEQKPLSIYTVGLIIIAVFSLIYVYGRSRKKWPIFGRNG
ncbi:nitrous oxide reductase family maturation protein NosD [Virgibacillus sp. MSJ-26]|uniref:nitrous oxide reductase family maturation protein NosD n=1 Tax=Virgibacillus sp. MSJ-26 TaxID=2841522 RepID=UPI001C0F8FD3|nr:nitrous oxide reductase family maturation protein NosD [Virgibacillus sp. MSJ-26]MBU5465308.1 nitrous oxide reductase family maturation protein NosD [Virgibacillus sp. MSJ-26]